MTRLNPDIAPTILGHRLPYLLLAVAPFCWAGNIVLARGVHEIIPPVAFAFWRWSIAFLLLLPLTWRQTKKDWPIAINQWKNLLLLSLLGISSFNTLLYKAVHTTTAINGALIQTSMPAFIVIISLFLYKERVSFIQVLGIVICIVGAAMVVLRGEINRLFSLSYAPGDLLMLLAVLCYAAYSAFLPQRPKIAPASFLTLTFGIGVAGLLPIYFWELHHLGGFNLSANTILSLLYVALFPSILAYFCWNKGIEIIGANRGGLFINLIPVFASILSIFWLGESLRIFHLFGMALIGGGMILFNR